MEVWAGIGGGMEAGTGKKQEKVGRKPRETASKGGSSGECNLGCSTCEASGALALKQFACATIKKKGQKITDSLCINAETGDLKSAQVLMLLLNPELGKEKVKKKKSGPTYAQELAAQAPWVEPVTEESAETGYGGREVEVEV